MSEGIVYADVKFKKHQRTEGKDGATASTANDATYSEISIPKAGRNQPSTDTNAGDPDSQEGSKVKPGGCDPVKVVLVTLCFLLMGAVIGLVFLYISNLPTKNTELQILQAAYDQNLTALMIKNRELQELQDKNKDLHEKERAGRQQKEKLRKQNTPPSCPTNTGNKDCPKPRNCAEDWEYYGGKCYYFSPDKLTWVQSRDDCITRAGHLVIIGSREEQKFLDQKIGREITTEPEVKFWIGLTDSTNENEWLWVDNSSLNSSTRFWLGDKEPDNWKGEKGEYPEGEDCARMGEPGGNTGWLDFNCNKTQRRICETKSPL
ncbi:asialoglycoprotein receptor 1-like isoform X1 [Salvelinus alpinus]|uniref:asialoglycoprotein receptor 1-like isoform X1 n=1 Tax=Salvelinus alpinus TaxID=8036 RepID=UPI0039FC012A